MNKLRTAFSKAIDWCWPIFELGIYGCCLLTLLGFFSKFECIFDLTCHFRFQYFWLLALLAVLASLRRKWILATMSVVAMIANGVLIAPLFLSAPPNVKGVEHKLDILDVNFNAGNSQFDSMNSLISETKPDIICWQEFSTDAYVWTRDNLIRDYPFSVRRPRDDNFGIAIFSKIPFQMSHVEHFSNFRIESIVVTVNIGDKPVDVVCTHTYPPIRSEAFHDRDGEMDKIGAFVRSSGHPSIVCGDLNATLWADGFQHLIKVSGLRDSELGFGLQPSWPVGLPVVRIPIDHVLVDPQIRVLSRQLGRDVHSDHLPVIVKLAI